VRKLLEDRFDFPILKTWLTLRYNPSDQSFIRGRKKISDSRKLTTEDFKIAKLTLSTQDLSVLLRQQLFDIIGAIVSRIPEKSHIGVLSSGGIDSTAILAILLKLGYQPEAITLGFGGENDEIESAHVVAEYFSVEHKVHIKNRILDSTGPANEPLDEPYRAACYYYDALKFARDCGIQHVFDGLGIDEFFGGYGFRYKKVLQLIDNGCGRVESYLKGAHPNDYVDSDEMFGPKLKGVEINWSNLFPFFSNNGLSILEQIFIADYNAKCCQNFIPLARLESKLGLHIYYPWLADRLIDFSLRVPSELKYDSTSGRTKILFRKAIEDLVPPATLKKPKQGFAPSLGQVMNELRPLLEGSVLDGLLVSSEYLDRSYYKTAIEAHSPSTVQINKCWDAFTLETFLRRVCI